MKDYIIKCVISTTKFLFKYQYRKTSQEAIILVQFNLDTKSCVDS